MGSLRRRTGVLEEYIESQVALRMRLEVEALLDYDTLRFRLESAHAATEAAAVEAREGG
jgi:hypothetical protein